MYGLNFPVKIETKIEINENRCKFTVRPLSVLLGKSALHSECSRIRLKYLLTLHSFLDPCSAPEYRLERTQRCVLD